MVIYVSGNKCEPITRINSIAPLINCTIEYHKNHEIGTKLHSCCLRLESEKDHHYLLVGSTRSCALMHRERYTEIQAHRGVETSPAKRSTTYQLNQTITWERADIVFCPGTYAWAQNCLKAWSIMSSSATVVTTRSYITWRREKVPRDANTCFKNSGDYLFCSNKLFYGVHYQIFEYCKVAHSGY